jgi:hypothetical protein
VVFLIARGFGGETKDRMLDRYRGTDVLLYLWSLLAQSSVSVLSKGSGRHIDFSEMGKWQSIPFVILLCLVYAVWVLLLACGDRCRDQVSQPES